MPEIGTPPALDEAPDLSSRKKLLESSFLTDPSHHPRTENPSPRVGTLGVREVVFFQSRGCHPRTGLFYTHGIFSTNPSGMQDLLRGLPALGRSFARIVRMTDTAASEAARQLVAQRWGSQRPARLARELLPRLDELPAEERSRLLDALRDEGRRHV